MFSKIKTIIIEGAIGVLMYVLCFLPIWGGLAALCSILMLAALIGGWPFGTETEPSFVIQWVKGLRVCGAADFVLAFIMLFQVYTED